MAGAKKVDTFIAIPLRIDRGSDGYERIENLKLRVWDMMRYDRCFPVIEGYIGNTDGTVRWLVLMQPHREGIAPGMTFARWDSFGVRHGLYATSTQQTTSIPTCLSAAIYGHIANGSVPNGWVQVR